MRLLAALLLLPVLAGCTTPAAPGVPQLLPPPAPGLPALPAPLAMKDCRGSLHVWFVPAEALAKQLPADFPPLVTSSPLAPPGSAQLEFHIVNCAQAHTQSHNGAAPASLGMFAARVVPRDKELAKNATAYYALHAFGRGDAPAALAAWAGIPWSDVEVQDAVASAPALDLPRYDVSLQGDAAGGFAAHVQGAQPEKYERAMRVFRVRDGATRALDFGVAGTLWEGTGSADFADGSAFSAYVPLPAKLAGDQHVLASVQAQLAARR